MLADKNDFPCVDIAKFGNDIGIIIKRATFEKESALTELGKTVQLYKDYYQYEEI